MEEAKEMRWSEQQGCWICSVCQKRVRSKQGHKEHLKKDCLNKEPQNPSWQLGWDKSTMGCRYCLQTFSRRRGIRRHLQLRMCPKLPDWDKVFGRPPKPPKPPKRGQGRKAQRGKGQRSQPGKAAGPAAGKGILGPVPGTEDDPREEESNSSDEEGEEEVLPPGERAQWTGVNQSGEEPWEEPLLQGGGSDRISPHYSRQSSQGLYSSQRDLLLPQRCPARRADSLSTQVPGMKRDSELPSRGNYQVWPPDDDGAPQTTGPTRYPRQAVLSEVEGLPSRQMNSPHKDRSRRYTQQSSREYPERWREEVGGDPQKTWSDRSFHTSHSGSSQTWAGNQRENWTCPEQEPQLQTVDYPQDRYDHYGQDDDRYKHSSHSQWTERRQSSGLIDPDNQERRDRSEEADRRGGRPPPERYNTQARFPCDTHGDQDRRWRCDREDSWEGRWMAERQGHQGTSSHHGRHWSPQEQDSRFISDRSGDRERSSYDIHENNHDTRRRGPYREDARRDHAPRNRSRSPVRHRETKGRSQYAEKGAQGSHRTNRGHERYPVPEEPTRRTAYYEDTFQEPREYSGSRDAGYSGYRTDRGKGRYRHCY